MKLDPISRRAALVGLTTAGLSACTTSGRSRYRMDVTVEVGGRSFFGAGVAESETIQPVEWLPNGGVITRVKGEAAIVELGESRVLVATLRGYNYSPMAEPRSRAKDSWNGAPFAAPKGSSPTPVHPNFLPAFAFFEDRRDPTSYVMLDPIGLAEDRADGLVLKRATLVSTHERIFSGRPQRIFPWLEGSLEAAKKANLNIDGSKYDGDDPELWASDLLLRRS
jgi:hypothetical protein